VKSRSYSPVCEITKTLIKEVLMATHEPLLPVRHPNADFFIADIFDSIPVKSDRHSMEHPFFALSTKKDGPPVVAGRK
jgi:hypothetical protein